MPPRARETQVGKRVGGALYVHVSALAATEQRVQDLVSEAVSHAPGFTWNVAKVASKAVSLLLYEDFDVAAFPTLLGAVRIDLANGSTSATNYRQRKNPPILHRKELLLAADDPRRPAFAALTRAVEDHGLFCKPTKIGTRQQWAALLDAAGLRVEGQRVLPVGTESIRVARHRTAIVRRELSLPMQLAVAHGVLTPGSSVFDYGCGQGDDVAALAAAGYETFGWDPHHAPYGPRRSADVVNLGFVLNVVEDRHERMETLKAAYSFARRALSVAVMVAGKTALSGLRPYRDGYLTSRGTFQKYFSQQELRDFIEETLGEAPVALGPGIFVVFRDKELEQEVLLRRRSRQIARPVGMRPPERARAARTVHRPALVERVKSELEQLWAAMLQRGRILDVEEIPDGLRERLHTAKVSPARATELCLSDLFEQENLATTAAARREDLLVHLALTLFPGAPRYTTLPRSIQRDVRAFFGNHATALQEARHLLFSAGNPDSVRGGIEAAVKAGLGAMRDEDTFRFHLPALNRMPAIIRVLVGCGGILRGGVEAADFVDVKLGASRLSFLACNDASAKLPLVAERTRIDLRRLKVTIDKPNGLVLYLKGRFLPTDWPKRAEQIEFDRRLLASGVASEDARGPTFEALKELLRKRRAARAAKPRS